MRHTALLLTGATWLALGCGDGGTGPGTDGEGRRLAAQFERLADSVEAGGYSPAADALRHAGEIVRLTGHATPVNVTIDGTARSFLAVAEQIDFPNLICSWPSDSGIVTPGGDPGGMPGDTVIVPLPPQPVEPPECTVEGSYSMRTLIAWEPGRMAEVVRIVAHIGEGVVEQGVPDVMTGLPTNPDPPGGSTPPDSGSGSGGEPGGWPGFMGEYLVRDVGSWYAVEGSQRNELEGSGGACADDRATFDWAEFDCEAARYRFEFGMTVQPVNWERLTGAAGPATSPEGSHALAMGSNAVDGVRLTWVAWTPPPEPWPGPGPDPIPVDSMGVAVRRYGR
ncbi:MAG: hypothetical protein ABI703_07415 [Gemmatimonadales bacterium]